MRIPFSLFLLLLALMVRGQDVIQHQENVEKGLTFPATLEFGEEFAKASIEERLKAEKIPGASVAIVSEGRIAWTETYGVKEALGSDPVASETLFQCASIGKVITALGVLRLADKGKVDLNEDVNEQLKRWKIKGNGFTDTQKVTPKHLLSHSAGLTDDYGFLGYSPQSEIPSLLQILKHSECVLNVF